MNSTPKSGRTLLISHLPQAHLSLKSGQFKSFQRYRQSRPFNLCHSLSLPERADLPREVLGYGRLKHLSKANSLETPDRTQTNNSRRYDSCSLEASLDFSHSSDPRKHHTQHCDTRWQNLFIPEMEVNEDEEDEEFDGDNLRHYQEGSALQLQGDCNVGQSKAALELKTDIFSFYDIERDQQAPQSDYPDLRKESPVFMDCGEKDWADEGESRKPTRQQPDFEASTYCFLDSAIEHQDCLTDSSCNSSDGVLVNFSTIYNKTNNAVPADSSGLTSPVQKTSAEKADGSSSPSLDPNCNIYLPDVDGFSSTETSDMSLCQHRQSRLVDATQNYYKLVTCDLSSHSSPSPLWSSLTSFPETHSQGSCSPPSEYFLFKESEEDQCKAGLNCDFKDFRQGTLDQSKNRTRRGKTTISSREDFQSRSFSDSNVSSPQSGQQATSFAEMSQFKKKNATLKDSDFSDCQGDVSTQKCLEYEKCEKCANKEISCLSSREGACASMLVRYTKAQRPTSLPIQPFVLEVSGKQQVKNFESLLNQYINHKKFKPECKSKTNLSPFDSYSNVHLEANTSPDTCSTCTSSPICSQIQPRSTQPYTMQDRNFNPESTPKADRPLACSSPSHSSQQHRKCHPEPSSHQNQTSSGIIDELLFAKPCSSDPSSHGSSPVFTSVTALLSPHKAGPQSLPAFEAHNMAYPSFGSPCKTQENSCSKKEHQKRDCVHITDKPQEINHFSQQHLDLSQDAVHIKSLLKNVSLAVNAIKAHFRTREDLKENTNPDNVFWCGSLSQLVLKQFCPAIQNLLQDGLKAHTLDLIIGQRRNTLWNIVESTVYKGSSTQASDRLVSVVKKCSQFPNHGLRFNVFIVDLLNLRLFAFWIHHLYTCVDVVKEHYHQWGFWSVIHEATHSPFFQELLLLLQPLSVLAFDLHLAPELLHNSKQKVTLPFPLLSQSVQTLQMSSIQKNTSSSESIAFCKSSTYGLWLNQTTTPESKTTICIDDNEMKKEKHEAGIGNGDVMRWVRLFGSRTKTSMVDEKRQKPVSGITKSLPPSEWLKLGVSKMDLVAQSMWTRTQHEKLLSNGHDAHNK